MMVALAAIAIAPIMQESQAADVSQINFVTAGTLTNNTTRTNFTTQVIKIDQQTQAALVINMQGDGSATDNVVVTLSRGADGTTFETTPPTTLKFTNALANTSKVVGWHQIPKEVIGSAYALRIVSVVNAATSVSATNVTIGIVKKREPQ